MEKNKLDEQITLRIKKGDVEVIRMIAESTRRPLSQVLRLIIEDYVDKVNKGEIEINRNVI